jgi:hypothetical protein
LYLDIALNNLESKSEVVFLPVRIPDRHPLSADCSLALIADIFCDRTSRPARIPSSSGSSRDFKTSGLLYGAFYSKSEVFSKPIPIPHTCQETVPKNTLRRSADRLAFRQLKTEALRLLQAIKKPLQRHSIPNPRRIYPNPDF